jgi:hypothetical protein
MRLKAALRAVVFSAASAAVLIGAGPAAARNRTTEMLIADIARRAGVSYETARSRSDTQTGEDIEMYPGVFESSGGFSYSYGGSARTLIAVRIFNENNFAICVRSNAALIGGPMAGSEQGESLGYNVLIEPRSSEPVIANSVARSMSVNNISNYATRYYFWLAAPAGTERRCSSMAPADVDRVDRAPLPPVGQAAWSATPEFRAKLGG